MIDFEHSEQDKSRSCLEVLTCFTIQEKGFKEKATKSSNIEQLFFQYS